MTRSRPEDPLLRLRSPERRTRASRTSYRPTSDDPQVVNDPHRQEQDIHVGESDAKQADPSEEHVPLVKHREHLPQLVPERRAREAIEMTACEVTARMARERVQRKQRR